jgi:hypothetical protein
MKTVLPPMVISIVLPTMGPAPERESERKQYLHGFKRFVFQRGFHSQGLCTPMCEGASINWKVTLFYTSGFPMSFFLSDKTVSGSPAGTQFGMCPIGINIIQNQGNLLNLRSSFTIKTFLYEPPSTH